jgi:glucose-6-phosphate isomerase
MLVENIYAQNFKNISTKKISDKLRKSCNAATLQLRSEILNKKLAPIDVVFEKNDLKSFETLAKKISPYSKIIVLGVGGSSLGGKTLTALRDQTKLEFLESIDPTTIKNCLDKIDFKNTFFVVISKSGETIETICQTLIVLDRMREAKIKDIAKQFLFVTQSKSNSIAKIAKEIGAEIAHHPEKIGGRYSCFSIVGMLPTLLCGIDAKKVRHGAQKVIDDFLNNDTISNSCAIQLSLYEQGFTNNVVMPYIDILKNFTDWYRQLWAESLGKSGFGSTPINSMGTVDQHSQLQLYLEGPKDKFFTFVTLENHENDFLVKDLKSCPTLFGGKKLSDIVKVEQETTIEVLNKKKLPIRIFEIEKLNEEVLGGLMMQCFLETILISYAKKINPFDQPAVELRKDLAKKILKKDANKS